MGVSRRISRRFFGVAAATAVILAVAVPFGTGIASAGSGGSASISDCHNGPLSGHVSCGATTYKTGDLVASSSHYREGDFVPYVTAVSGLGAGTHDLYFGYDVTNGGAHAQDYLGSYDVTETTSPTPSTLFANNNNPCATATTDSTCTPSSPQSQGLIPAPNFAGSVGCQGAGGSWGGTFPTGYVDMFGAPGTSSITSVTYVDQNVVSGGACQTDVDIKFNLTSAQTNSLLFTWGGHVSSEQDWGAGTTAAFINGSAYHMFLNGLDSSSIGSQDLQMKTSAVFFTPSVSTTIIDAANPATTPALSGPINIGTTIHDTATLSDASATAGGSITFTLRNDTGTTACAGTTIGTPQKVTFSNGAANSPNSVASADFTPTLGGTYSYQATYSGDTSDVPGNFTSACEPFTVQGNTPTLSTIAQYSTNNSTFNNVGSTTLAIGDYVRDTSSLTGTASPVAGSVTYKLYPGTTCTGNTPDGTALFTSTQTVSSATPPPSGSTQLLTAGDYQWQAVFTSSNNQNTGATSGCGTETFTVGPNSPTLNTQAQSSSSSSSGFTNITGDIAIGSYVRDTASLTGAATPTTGSVLYTLYTGTGCSANAPTGTSVFTDTQTLASNAIPPSLSHQLLTAGSYQWQAVYTSGNGQNNNATSLCGSETFTVAPNAPTLATQAQSSSNNVSFTNVTGSLTIGTYVRDTASLTGAATPTTGSVVYTLYTGKNCSNNTPTGTVAFTDTETLASNAIPPSLSTQLNTAGDYQWQAVYTSGNGQNLGATSPCGSETFTVGPNTPTLSTQAQSSANNVSFTNISGAVPIGTYVRDTASLTGAATPTTGSVLYTLYTGTSCSSNTPTGTVVFSDTETLASNAIPPSLSTQLNTAGNYQWQAVYTSGNGQNGGATSDCGSETFTVGPNNPTLNTQAQSSSNNSTFTNITGPIAIGDYVRDTASLTGAATPTTGSVVYTLYNGTGCSGNAPTGTVVFTDTQTLASNAIPPSLSTQLLTAGAYQWQAVYTSGNGQNSNATSACASETFTVSPNSPTLSTQAQSSSSSSSGFTNITGDIAIGSYVRDTASLTGAATPTTGSVVYTLYTGTTCTGNNPDGTSVFTDTQTLASNAIPPSLSHQLVTAGSYQWQAVYTSGNGQNNNATSPCGSETFTVAPNAPTLSTQAQSSSSSSSGFTNITGDIAIGSYVRDTASLTGAATPTTGSVAYTLYSGTGCDGSSPTGSVVFTDTETLASNAIPPSVSTQLLTAGDYQWQAVYTSGNGQNLGATSPCGSEAFTVAANAPSLNTTAQESSDNTTFVTLSSPVVIGTWVRDTASLTGAATPTTGSVLYTLYTGTGCSDNTPTGSSVFTSTKTLASNAIPASGSTQLLTAGDYQWQAVYTSGNGQNLDATSACGSETFTVAPNAPTLSTQAQSSSSSSSGFTNITGDIAIGSYVRDTASLTGAATPTTGSVAYTLYSGTGCDGSSPTGSVVFTDTETLASNAIPPSVSTQLQTAGTYQWQAVYTSGNGQNLDATSPCGSETFTVSPNSPTLSTQAQSSSNNTTFTNVTGPISIGTYVRDTATLSGAATPTTGSVAYTLYSGTACDGNAPTGTVVFTDTETLASNAIPPSLSTQLGTAGSYQWQAVYTSGNGQNNGATSPCGSETFTVSPNSPSLATTAQSSTDNVTFTDITGPVAIGDYVRDTALLTGAATPTTGTVVYALYTGTGCDGNAPTGTLVFTDTETLSTNVIPDSASTQLQTAGTYQWQAAYSSGNGQNLNATSPCGSEDFTVAPNAPTLSTQAQSSPDNVTFSDLTTSTVVGSFVRDTAALSGAATPTTGSVAYTLYSGTGCDGNTPTGSVVFTDTETLAANAIPPSASFQVTSIGNYQWQAVYTSGNGQNLDATSPCGSEAFLVTTPNFTVLKTDVPGDGNPVAPGSTIPYTVTIQNVGNGPGSATITDTLPSNLTIQGTPACAVTAPDTCTVTNTTGSTWTFDVSLASGSTATVTFSATVSTTDTADVVNTATITRGTCDPTLITGQAELSHAVTVQCSSTVTNPVPNFTVTKTDTPGDGQSVTAGSTIPYTVAIKNVGDGAGTATITDTLPSNLTIKGTPSCAVTGSDTCKVTNTTGSTWTFEVNLAAGDTATVTFSATVAATATGTVVNTATITTGPCNTSAGCSSTVSNPIPPVTAPAVVTPTTTTTAPPVTKPAVIAFTGADIAAMAAGGLALLGLGGLLVLVSRRRRRSAGEIA